MPGANCCIPTCSSSRRHPDISIFNIPRGNDDYNTEWRSKLIGIVTKYREVDEKFKLKIEKRDVAICEKHYTDEVKIYRKFMKYDLYCNKLLTNILFSGFFRLQF